MRVFELSKILDVPSQQIIKDLKRYHVQAKNHMSSVDDKVVRKLLAYYEKKRVQDEIKKEEQRKKREEAEILRKKQEEERRQKEEEERKRREEEEARRRAEEERKRKEDEEARQQREIERRSSNLAELIQKRQIDSRTPRKPADKDKKTVKAKRPKDKRTVSGRETTPGEVPVGEIPPSDDRAPSRRKKFKKRRDHFTKPSEESEERPKTKRFRPTIFVAPPKAYERSMPSSPQRQQTPQKRVEEKPKEVELRGELTLGEFAEKIGVSAIDIIKKLLDLGQPMTINQMISADLSELIASEFNVEVKIIEESDERDIETFIEPDEEEDLTLRPPVVTVMGHVDHGKTTLLDCIRKSDVVGQEFGGITQHIGAYYVKHGRGSITFLDTPGHEAFTKMRARGAKATDIVVLVVAANDGVMPQTVEAINHARAAGVPIIVSINKIDLPEAEPLRVKQDLMKYELVPEEFGGQTIFVEISAKQGIGIDALLEMLILQAEIMELKANPKRPAVGVVIESHLDPLRGPLATILVQRGTLKSGDAFIAGSQGGKVRAMHDDYGRNIEVAGPSFPVEVIGFNNVPEVGERFVVVPNERVARRIAEVRQNRRQRRAAFASADRRVTLESIHEFVKEGKIKELRVVLKGDVQGSIEAVSEYLEKIVTEEVRVNIIHKAVGRISESDVDLAVASDAIIIGFNTVPDPKAKVQAELEKVDIKIYRIIYDLVEDVKKALLGMLESTYQEVFRSRCTVKQVFRVSKYGNVAGCIVDEGEVSATDKARLVRDGKTVYEGSIASLRRVKDDVKSVKSGTECGIKLVNFDDIKEGDIIETFRLEEVKPKLEIE